MEQIEALQKEIERLDQKIAEAMKGSGKDKDELIDGIMKRIQALEDRIASMSEKKETRGRPKKEKASPMSPLRAEPKKEEKQLDFTEEDVSWWERV